MVLKFRSGHKYYFEASPYEKKFCNRDNIGNNKLIQIFQLSTKFSLNDKSQQKINEIKPKNLTKGLTDIVLYIFHT